MNSKTKPESDGSWGEDAVGDISVNAALDEYHHLERELGTLQRSYSGSTHQKPGKDDENTSGNSNLTITPDLSGEDGEDQFNLADFLRKGIIDKRTPSGDTTKRLGVSFKNLTVKGVEASRKKVITFPIYLLNSFGPDLYNFFCGVFPVLAPQGRDSTVEIIRNMTGTVRHGEIMLVLGRPGSGCSTFLKTIANRRDEYPSVEGEVRYGSIPAKEQLKRFRGEVVYCEEDDRHFPTLTVFQTLLFALMTKTRKREQWTIQPIIDSLLQMFGIEHIKNTLIGDEFIRGVSGGERKRVSLAETLASRASIVCWDNSTRGLDSHTAYSFAKSLRVYTDVSQRTTLVTLYQAGESIYELMDKVLVIDQGRMLFQGPASEAKNYFENLGYLCLPRQTTADFLTSISDVKARRFKAGREDTAPKTAEELEQAFRKSEYYNRILRDVEDYERETTLVNDSHQVFETTVRDSKSKTVIGDSVYTVSYVKQIIACTIREFWLFRGMMIAFYIKLAIITGNALIISSLFHNIRQDTSSVLSRGGITFISTVFLPWVQFGELVPAIAGRMTIERQRIFAFYSPSAVVIARLLLDIPLILIITILFGVPVYFLAQFDVDAAKFWTYILIVYATAFSMTAMFRMLAALSVTIDDAIRFVGVMMSVLFIMTGYIIPKPALLHDAIWFGWINFLNPFSYGFEALLTNEFFGRQMKCSESQLVPRGLGSDPNFQGCSLPGSAIGSATVSGQDYLKAAFQYSRTHLWRNFGILVAFTVFFLAITVLTVEKGKIKASGVQSLMFAKSNSKMPEENGTEEASDQEILEDVGGSQSVFTFKNVNYKVPSDDGEVQLLHGVCGYAKPGKMIALMGSSGASKTTLLNTLAQRQSTGTVSGEILFNGANLGREFHRATGFCEQTDIHEGSATIREALTFSALLRQDRAISPRDKMLYVDKIIHLLELYDLQHALISSLSLEQKKRVTIGVELSAKPGLLLFLDEPTSGLDSQSAFSIIRFLRKLSDAGLAIICTIHQPSFDLMEKFDMILAINPGGRTFYFGPIGTNGSVIVDYFAQRGFPCPANRNVAEFIIETAATPCIRNGHKVDWNDEWLASDQHKAIIVEIDNIAAEKRQLVVTTTQVTVNDASVTAETEFAASTADQCHLLIKRMFLQHWREPSYIYSRLFVNTIMGVINGFTFFMLGNDLASMQNRMFSAVILILFMPPIVVNSVVPKFFGNLFIWEARELPSRTYGWVAFCTANIVCEIPMSLIGGTIYWLLWYFPVGYSSSASVSGYTYLMVIVWSLFQASWGQWIAGIGPPYPIIASIIPFFMVVATFFNGILAPYASMPVIWRYTLYYVNPTTWFSRGVLSAVLAPVAVQCSAAEFARFNPPPGLTCGQYASRFVDEVAKAGYLENPDAMADCSYCPYRDGAEYMRPMNIHVNDKWPAFGILLALAVTNWILIYLFIYTRVNGWTFGVHKVLRHFTRLFSRRREGSVQSKMEKA
ncbi:ABC-2 type transporter [Colletotrichum caudatum]|nr:ABC-2 type transporter [Colletotrichum caudatum]